MSSISERLRARLSKVSSAATGEAGADSHQSIKGETNNERDEKACTDTDDFSSSLDSRGVNTKLFPSSFGARDCEGSRADLRIACSLYIRARKYLYQNYMESAFLVFRGLIDEEAIERWMESYCQEPYPDVCCCGTRFVSNHGIVRSHCIGCIGNNVGLAYDMQRLSQELGIHYSWIEYGFAYALSQVGGAKI